MTNLEHMKQNLIDQILKMDAEAFNKLINILNGNYSVDELSIDLTASSFGCDSCKELYGECLEEATNKECLDRYKKYVSTKI